MTTPRPFQRGSFDALPERPRLPHPYFETRAETVTVDAPGFGPTKALVRVAGSGPPLLLVHGLMTSSYSFRYVLEPLGAHFTLYVPDLPGAGGSEGPLRPRYDPPALAGWLGALVGELGIRGCPVVANSMGGYLAMWLALTDAGAMSRLVNVHSPGIPELRLAALRAALAVPGMRAALARVVRVDPLRWAHRNVHYYDETLKSLEEARAYGEPISTPEGAAAFVKYLAETMAYSSLRAFVRQLRDRRDRGEPFPVPLLLLYAEQDPMVPPRVGDVLHELIPGSRLVRLKEASHFAHVDAVERFVPPVVEFLRE